MTTIWNVIDRILFGRRTPPEDVWPYRGQLVIHSGLTITALGGLAFAGTTWYLPVVGAFLVGVSLVIYYGRRDAATSQGD